MKQNKILIVDDDPIVLELLKGVLEKANYEVIASTNPREALVLFENDPTTVAILDLNMTEMSGKDLMLKMIDTENKPIVLFLTSETNLNTAIDLLKIGAHDYLLKPFKATELLSRVEKAFEYSELKLINENIQKERETRIEHQLNWNLFKENLIKKDSDKIDSGLMTNINTSLIQGAGIGMLAPLIKMIKDSMKEENETYIIDKELMDLVFENVDFSSKLTGTISDIDYVINNDLPKEAMTLSQFHEMLIEFIQDNLDFQKIKNHSVKLAEDTFSGNNRILSINRQYFKKVITELLLNSYKFSEPDSKIFILFETVKENFIISFLTTPEKGKDEENGIAKEYQNIIFEPFFRISRLVYENYRTLDFGLGLCHVEKIIRNHKGNVRVTNLKNFLENTNRVLISFSLEIPFTE